MRAYTYPPDSIGLCQWPSGELALAGMDAVTDPREADVFIVPGNLSSFRSGIDFDKQCLYRLPYYQGNEDRHVFFDVSDNFTKAVEFQSIFIRCDVRSWMLPADPNTIQVAWPVEDFSECMSVPEGGFKYDISFHAWLSSSARSVSSQACLEHPQLTCDMARYPNFTGYIYYEEEGIRRRSEFRRSMRESRIALCPESIPGVLPYRFFEAMSAGRVPLLVSSDYVLPFSSLIPYYQFVITLPRDSAQNAGSIARKFLSDYDDATIATMGRQARHYWERYLDCRKWPEIMGEAVRSQMLARACA